MKHTWRVFFESFIHVRSKSHGIKHMAYGSPQSFPLPPVGSTIRLLDNMAAAGLRPVTCSGRPSLSDGPRAARLTSNKARVSGSSSHFWTGMKLHNEGVGCGISEPLEQPRYGGAFNNLWGEISWTGKWRQKEDGEKWSPIPTFHWLFGHAVSFCSLSVDNPHTERNVLSIHGRL